jgi:hypothetical protein
MDPLFPDYDYGANVPGMHCCWSFEGAPSAGPGARASPVQRVPSQALCNAQDSNRREYSNFIVPSRRAERLQFRARSEQPAIDSAPAPDLGA